MELLEAISTVISSKNHFIFHRDNVSLIHDEGRPVDTFYQLRCDTLEIALQMGLSSTGFIVSNIILIQRAYSTPTLLPFFLQQTLTNESVVNWILEICFVA